MGRGHADVDERDVGTLVAHAREQRSGVADLGDDLEPGLGEQPGDALADQRRVVGDHDPHGISALMRRAGAGLALDDRACASSASSRSRRPARPESARRASAADAVVHDGHAKRAARALEAHRGLGRRGVLDDVRQGLRDQEVGGELDGVGQPIPDRSFHRHRKRRPPRERLDAPSQPLLAQQRRMNSAGELAQLRDRLVDLVLRARRARPSRPRRSARCRDPERQARA